MLRLLLPVLGVVRTTVDSQGTADAANDASFVRTAGAATAETLDLDAITRYTTEMQADPYWQSWVSASLGDNGWTSRPDGESLVGIKYKGHGPNPTGMQTANLASQKFTINLECLDQTSNLEKQLQRSGKIEWNAFHSSMLKEGKQAIGHLEGSQLHVLHEKAGEYRRANFNFRYLLGRGTVNGCQRLQLKAEQDVYMDEPMLEQNKAQKVQAMAAAGYSIDEMNAAVQAYGRQTVSAAFRSGPIGGYDKIVEEHDRAVQQMVNSGIIKKKDDYGLLQDLYSSLRTTTNEEVAGRFHFGEAVIKNVQAPQGKHVLVLEFKQTCGAAPMANTQLLGKTSPVNCSPGKRAALVLHGELEGSGLDAHYKADRVVMYLEK